MSPVLGREREEQRVIRAEARVLAVIVRWLDGEAFRLAVKL